MRCWSAGRGRCVHPGGAPYLICLHLLLKSCPLIPWGFFSNKDQELLNRRTISTANFLSPLVFSSHPEPSLGAWHPALIITAVTKYIPFGETGVLYLFITMNDSAQRWSEASSSTDSSQLRWSLAVMCVHSAWSSAWHTAGAWWVQTLPWKLISKA